MMVADSTSRVLQAIPPMSQGLKDWLQALAWLAAAAGFLLTVVKFWSEAKAGRLQRSQELRWRQAQAGKALNDEMQEDKFSWAAMQMLDSDGREFLLASGKKIEITPDHIVGALGADPSVKDELGEYIRDCFDTLFYYMAMLYHYTGSGLLHADDVAYPLEYYIPLLGEYYGAVSAYLARNKLTRTERFLAKYDTWREPGSIAPKPPAPAIEQ